jgi:hypothetical protein
MKEILRTEDAGPDGLTEEQMRQNVINLAFGGDDDKFQEFCDLIQVAVPPGTSAVLRGSSVTGERYDDGAPFDADGPGTSDLDLTLIGGDVVDMYNVLTGTYFPGVHTKPMGDDHPDIAPSLEPLREKLCSLVCRPVNIQASRDIWQQLRGDLMGQPYLTLFGEVGG